MPRDVRKWVWDIRDAGEHVARFTEGRSFRDYQADALLRSAVERQLGIMGEALNQLHQAQPALAERITGWKLMIGFRNKLIHGYFQVSHQTVWDTITVDLPVLRREAEALLTELDSQPEEQAGH